MSYPLQSQGRTKMAVVYVEEVKEWKKMCVPQIKAKEDHCSMLRLFQGLFQGTLVKVGHCSKFGAFPSLSKAPYRSLMRKKITLASSDRPSGSAFVLYYSITRSFQFRSKGPTGLVVPSVQFTKGEVFSKTRQIKNTNKSHFCLFGKNF